MFSFLTQHSVWVCFTLFTCGSPRVLEKFPNSFHGPGSVPGIFSAIVIERGVWRLKKTLRPSASAASWCRRKEPRPRELRGLRVISWLAELQLEARPPLLCAAASLANAGIHRAHRASPSDRFWGPRSTVDAQWGRASVPGGSCWPDLISTGLVFTMANSSLLIFLLVGSEQLLSGNCPAAHAVIGLGVSCVHRVEPSGRAAGSREEHVTLLEESNQTCRNTAGPHCPPNSFFAQFK